MLACLALFLGPSLHAAQIVKISKGKRIIIATIKYSQTAACSGFDSTTRPLPWIMAPENGSNSATVTIAPSAEAGKIRLIPKDTIASITPDLPPVSPSTETVTGKTITSHFVNTTIQSKLDPGGITQIDTLNVSVIKKRTVSVHIFSVIESSDSLVPQNAPTAMQLQNYLNNTVYGPQANVFFDVVWSSISLHYDLEGNRSYDDSSVAEEQLFTQRRDASVNLNIFYVNMIKDPDGADGLTIGTISWLQDDHGQDSAVNITAHEIGHALNLALDSQDENSRPPNDVMSTNNSSGNPCSLEQRDWVTLQTY